MFGCYAADPWRVHTRFYGTGETCGKMMDHPLIFIGRHLTFFASQYFNFIQGSCYGVGAAYTTIRATLHTMTITSNSPRMKGWV